MTTVPRSGLRRWGPWLLLLAVLVAVLAVGVRRTSHPTLEQRTLQLAGQVRCPVCAGQSAAQSDTPASLAIRDLIRQKLQAGESPSGILDDLVGSYGTGILEKPEARGVGLLVWTLPVVLVAAALTGLGVAFARWRPRKRPVVTGEDRQIVAEALEGSAGPASPPSASPSAPGEQR